MAKNETLYLTGFMGTGKSAAGKRAAAKMGWEFVDTDKLVEERKGKSVALIFEEEGEEAFRESEREVLLEAGLKGSTVVSTGGGAPAYKNNLEIMKKNGVVSALMAAPEEILKRVSQSRTPRPLLNCPDPLAKIICLMQARAYYYITSDFIIDTDNKTVQETAEEIIKTASFRRFFHPPSCP